MADRTKPFRDVDDHEIINLYTFDGAAVDAGVLVKVEPGKGWQNSDDLLFSRVGATYNNTVSDRWAVAGAVSIADSGDHPVGMTLYEVSENDENSEQLIFNPRKATEKGVVRSGEVVPILTRGTVLLDSGAVDGFPLGGEPCYPASGGKFGMTGATDAINSYITPVVGMFLGAHDDNGDVLVHIHAI